MLLGMAVGDALGVPVAFSSREERARDPVTGMRGYGTHYQPPGTWSDDSSLAFCLAESLCRGYRPDDIGERFVRWLFHGYWTAHGRVFDVGTTTRRAIGKLKVGAPPEKAGGGEERDNGNGSLMRILPLLAHTRLMPWEEALPVIRAVSGLTHAHPRSVLGCVLLLELASRLASHDLAFAMIKWQGHMGMLLAETPWLSDEKHHYGRLLFDHRTRRRDYLEPLEAIRRIPRDQIRSDGYVVHTLEAALWCLVTTGCYREAVLAAVNLGGDTDSVGAVTGGLAGLLYGHRTIPQEWLVELARRDDILELAGRLDAYHLRQVCGRFSPA